MKGRGQSIVEKHLKIGGIKTSKPQDWTEECQLAEAIAGFSDRGEAGFVTDADAHPVSTAGQALHIEPGLFMNVPASDTPRQDATIVRMASIPHGVTVMMQGPTPSAAPVPGKPHIPHMFPLPEFPAFTPIVPPIPAVPPFTANAFEDSARATF